MLESGKRIWSFINSILLVLILVLILLAPEKIFIIDNHISLLEKILFLSLVSNAVYFIITFTLSFVKIQRVRPCMGFTVFNLLGSGFSIVLLMIIKVMSDELAHEWQSQNSSIWSEGEYFILIISFLLMLAIQIPAYFKRIN
mgnify:CR=1 FL=1